MRIFPCNIGREWCPRYFEVSIKGSKGARLQVGLASRAFVDEESLLGHAAQTLGLYILASERVKRSESKAGNLDDTCDSPRAPHRKQPMFFVLFFGHQEPAETGFIPAVCVRLFGAKAGQCRTESLCVERRLPARAARKSSADVS